jgi:small subunit ribosomal protein S6
MPLYESTFIARHDMSTRQVESLAEDLTTIVKDNGGEVAKTEFWGPRTLAYRIKKNRKGHYVFFNLDAPSEAVQEYERNMRLNEDVLRYMTVRVDELDPNPSAIMQSRSARDDRSRRGGPGRDHGDAAKGDAAKGDAAKADAAKGDGEAAKATDEPAAKAEPAAAADDKAKSPDPVTSDATATAAEATPPEAGSEAADAADADTTPAEVESKAADTKKAKPKPKAKAKSKAKKSDGDAADDGASSDEDGETS